VFGVAFAPNVKGLPKAVQKSFRYVVTELGYIYPDRANDPCLAKIHDAEYQTNSSLFTDTECYDTGS